MSKGSKVVPVRVPKELLLRIELQIASRNMVTREAPWSMSDFIRVSMERNLRKMERSRDKKK